MSVEDVSCLTVRRLELDGHFFFVLFLLFVVLVHGVWIREGVGWLLCHQCAFARRVLVLLVAAWVAQFLAHIVVGKAADAAVDFVVVVFCCWWWIHLLLRELRAITVLLGHRKEARVWRLRCSKSHLLHSLRGIP